MEINARTKLCGVIGHPVEHSLSPAIHNAAFQKLGLNHVYLAFRVEDLESAIRGIRALGNVRGFTDAGVTLKGQRVLMVGSGGAARAIAFALAAQTGIDRLTILGIEDAERHRLVDDLCAKT